MQQPEMPIIEIKSMEDALLDDSPERRKAMLKTFNNVHGRPIATNVLLNHLIDNIKRLDRTTATLNIVMIFLTFILVAFAVCQFFNVFNR
jgi:hypothetical protein